MNRLRTRHFLFYTGGADSTLILNMLLDKMLKNKHKKDELVILIISTELMGSGLPNKLGDILYQLNTAISNIDDSVFSRISIVNPMTTMLLGTNKVENITGKVGRIPMCDGMSLKDYRFSMLIQELVLIGSLPSLSSFLGECKNIFYMGVCGSDIGSAQVEQLQQLFNLNFQIMFYMGRNNSLMKEWGKFNNPRSNSLPEEFIPTLQFPLVHLKKSEVIEALLSNSLYNFNVDKIEDLLEYYSMHDMQMFTYLNFYHETCHNQDLHAKKVTTSLRDFIKTNIIKCGEEVVATKEDFEKSIEACAMKLFGRIKV